jgi:hypothetical protein
MIDVTEEEYLAELASGLQEDEVLKPGRHQFKRGGFLARHGIEPQRAAATQVQGRSIYSKTRGEGRGGLVTLPRNG